MESLWKLNTNHMKTPSNWKEGNSTGDALVYTELASSSVFVVQLLYTYVCFIYMWALFNAPTEVFCMKNTHNLLLND